MQNKPRLHIVEPTTQMSHSMSERVLLRTMQGMAWGTLFAGATIVMLGGFYLVGRHHR